MHYNNINTLYECGNSKIALIKINFIINDFFFLIILIWNEIILKKEVEEVM